MDGDLNAIKKMHQTEGEERIQAIQRKIDTTLYNMEISDEIIADTPSDAQAEKLQEKNTKRQHAVAGLNREIRDIEQAIAQDL